MTACGVCNFPQNTADQERSPNTRVRTARPSACLSLPGTPRIQRWFPAWLNRTRGTIITDENQKTSVEGLYAAGDICVKPLRQVITAASDGAVAAAALEKYCGALRGESCI